MESKTSSKTKAGLVVLAIFVIGFAGGALSMNLYQRATAGGAWRNGKPQDFIIQKMDERLKLTSQQREQIRAVLDDNFSRYSEIRKEIEPRMSAVRQQGREKIRAVLTPEQLPKFEEMTRKIDDHERERMNQSQKK